jgi:hypothetical protein
MDMYPVCKLSCCDSSSEWKRVMPLERMEKDARRMHEHASQEPRAQVPPVTRPDVAHAEATRQRRKDRLHARAHTGQDTAMRALGQRRRCFFAGRLQGNAQTHYNAFEVRQPTMAVAQEQSARPVAQSEHHRSFCRVPRGQASRRLRVHERAVSVWLAHHGRSARQNAPRWPSPAQS